jgi:S1-C subfamily serine protease
VNPGNSGGALVNTNGDLIGINTAISSRTGSYIGYSFAVPSNIARKIVNDIMEYGNVQNGMLGVVGGTINSKFAEENGLDTTQGFYVSDVQEDTGAKMAGIRSGDIIKKIDNIEINKFSDLAGYLKTKSPNDVVKVTLLRDGNIEVVPVTLLKPTVTLLQPIGEVRNASQSDLERYNIEYGVKISDFNDEYEPYLKQDGIEEGGIVTKINGQKLYSIDDVQKAIKTRDYNKPMFVEVINKEGEKLIYRF